MTRDRHTVAPIHCVQCKAPVEEARRCYATPICYACLPPPKPLPVSPVRKGDDR